MDSVDYHRYRYRLCITFSSSDTPRMGTAASVSASRPWPMADADGMVGMVRRRSEVGGSR